VVVWFGRQIYDFLLPSSSTVTVPSFVGQTLTDANAEIERLKLSSAVVDHTTSDRYPKDVVIMQRPDSGMQVRQGRQVSFVISDGIVSRLMPDLRYQSMREVQLDLSLAHLQLGKVTYVRNDLIPDGHVVSQNPSPLVSVHEGDAVTLTVSRGARRTVPVPNFVGLSVDEARALAAKSGIKVGQIVWTPLGKDGPRHGMVARQVPPPNAKIASFDPVAQNGQQLEVRLSLTDATGRYDLYRAFAEPGQKLDFTVTAIGTSLLDMYVNDSLVGETRLGTEPPRVYNVKASPTPGSEF
jgi:beta-lactam-binding protein with PASTA domain